MFKNGPKIIKCTQTQMKVNSREVRNSLKFDEQTHINGAEAETRQDLIKTNMPQQVPSTLFFYI